VTGNADASYGKTAGGVLNAKSPGPVVIAFNGTALNSPATVHWTHETILTAKDSCIQTEPVWRSAGGSSMERPTRSSSAITRECGQNLGCNVGPTMYLHRLRVKASWCSECSTGPGHGSCCPERSEISCSLSLTHRPPRFHGNTGSYSFVGRR